MSKFVMTESGRILTRQDYEREQRFNRDWSRLQEMERRNREWKLIRSELDQLVNKLDILIDTAYINIGNGKKLTAVELRALLSNAAAVVTKYYEEKENKNA